MSLAEHQPFFSIIIPTYNRATKLANAIKSLLAQEFTDFEIIVIDDGSTDNTLTVVDNLAQDHPSIKYFRKKNEERSIARNYGISKAKAKYIGFLDSDDRVYSCHLKVAYELLKKNHLPEVGHLGFRVVTENGEVISTSPTFDQSVRQKLIHENVLIVNAIFIRSDIAQAINFINSPEAIVSEDWYVWLRLAARYPIYFDNTITSDVIHHSERSLLNLNPDKLIASTNIVVNHLKKDKEFVRVYKSTVGYHFANHYTLVTLVLALTKARRKDVLRFLWKAISYDPSVIFRKRFLASVKHWF